MHLRGFAAAGALHVDDPHHGIRDVGPADVGAGLEQGVVPYKKIEYDPLPAFEVVLGASCPMRPDELGIRVLMDEKLRTRLTVSLSAVPVRA
jgi:hypothetical protein